jgi:predicted molibdopterin-dependent oxidoreductase YjgC
VGECARGKGKFTPVEYKYPDEMPDDQFPLILTTGRLLTHFHTGTMTRRVEPLDELEPHNRVWINTVDAEKLDVENGQEVAVQSRRGTIRLEAWVTDKVSDGVVFIPFHFGEAPANALTNPALDPVAKIPEYKVAAVRIVTGKPMEELEYSSSRE